MNCPVCSEKMKAVERSGVEVEICPGCKGIWLDRGELDKLLALDDGDEAAQDIEAASAPDEPAPAKDAGSPSVFDPVPDEMPAEYKHQDRSRFRDTAKRVGAGAGGHKPVVPRGGSGKASRGRGAGRAGSPSVRDILESIRKGGAG